MISSMCDIAFRCKFKCCFILVIKHGNKDHPIHTSSFNLSWLYHYVSLSYKAINMVHAIHTNDQEFKQHVPIQLRFNEVTTTQPPLDQLIHLLVVSSSLDQV